MPSSRLPGAFVVVIIGTSVGDRQLARWLDDQGDRRLSQTERWVSQNTTAAPTTGARGQRRFLLDLPRLDGRVHDGGHQFGLDLC